jgi:hypothetical protein
VSSRSGRRAARRQEKKKSDPPSILGDRDSARKLKPRTITRALAGRCRSVSEMRGVTLKRSRGRGRRPQNSHNRSFESAGPDVKIRGTASQIYEKYLQLARDANSSGDRIQAENYHQHAEHYFRIVQASQPAQTAAGAAPNATPNPPNGNGEVKPNGGDQVNPAKGAPSFSLAEGVKDEDGA